VENVAAVGADGEVEFFDAGPRMQRHCLDNFAHDVLTIAPIELDRHNPGRVEDPANAARSDEIAKNVDGCIYGFAVHGSIEFFAEFNREFLAAGWA